MAMLQVSGLNKTYPGPRPVLRDISFDLGDNETLAVVGPSGCGKTTLLYIACGLARPDPDSGDAVLVQGRPVQKPSPEIAFILQDYGLLPWKTVLANAALGLAVRRVPRRERVQRAKDVLARVGLAGREKDYPACLSGGEQQRVAIARAYAQEPKLLLMDEPFSSLDAITREKLQRIMLEMWRDMNVPFVLVTHSVEEAVFLGSRILILAGSPARVRAVFENPGFGEIGYRGSEEYFAMTARVRKAMEAYW